MPVLARNVVATSQPLAAAAGLRALHAGGNAIDAAIATAIALTVVEPTSNGIGGDAFAIVWDGSELHGLNASGRSPAQLRAGHFAGRAEYPLYGEATVTTPGAVSAWTELHRRFGSLPLETLAAPAIGYARDGFPVSPITARAWQRAERTYAGRADFAAAFLPGGRAPAAGELWRQADQAATLEAIVTSGGEGFYRGELAARIAAHVRAGGGWLAESDLAEHRPAWVGTLEQPFHGAELHEIPPNGQGLAALIALGILRSSQLHDVEPDSPEAFHVEIEAMKLGFADAHRYVADPDYLDLDPRLLLNDDYLTRRASTIDPMRAGEPSFGVPRHGGTVYLATADREGRMVSYIQSNYHGFGSGVVVPGTGIALQNRAAGFTLEAGHPNQVGPSKRPFHTIVPAFLTRSGAPHCAFGVMGGAMQPQGHLQMVLRTVVWGQNPQAAVDAPRWRLLEGRTVALEAGVPNATAAALEEKGHIVTRAAPDDLFSFGGAQLIERLREGGYAAGSDPRKDGQAVGF